MTHNVDINWAKRVLDLAKRQLDQDSQALSGPSITPAMLEDVAEDKRAVEKMEKLVEKGTLSGEVYSPSQEEYLAFEIMDRAYSCCVIFDNLIKEHQNCSRFPELRSLAEKVEDALAEFYSKTSSIHIHTEAEEKIKWKT